MSGIGFKKILPRFRFEPSWQWKTKLHILRIAGMDEIAARNTAAADRRSKSFDTIKSRLTRLSGWFRPADMIAIDASRSSPFSFP